MQGLKTTLFRVREKLYGRDVAELMQVNCDITIYSDGVDMEWQ